MPHIKQLSWVISHQTIVVDGLVVNMYNPCSHLVFHYAKLKKKKKKKGENENNKKRRKILSTFINYSILGWEPSPSCH